MPFRVPFAKPHDETWFFVRSLYLLGGDWMGEAYSHRTNMKGPMYSIFMASLSQLGISFKLAITCNLYNGMFGVFGSCSGHHK